MAVGLACLIPGVHPPAGKTGGTDSARYCYSVWLRHLVMAERMGLDSHPETVAELGPGDSLGIGLAALLAGANRYLAFDIVEHADSARNLEIFDELLELFGARAEIPGETEYPGIYPTLESWSFPSEILTDRRLGLALEKGRIERIRGSIRAPACGGSMIQYRVPWFDSSIVRPGSVDLIYSQAVLEHVDDLRGTYRAMHEWLAPGGFISHQIDFGCHGTADEWNGHWAYPSLEWTLIKGARPYLLNREPCSVHLRMMAEAGFELVTERRVHLASNLKRNDLARRFQSISGEDLTTRGIFLQAIRRSSG